MEIKPVAVFSSALREKFGIPRQSGLAPDLEGQVTLLEPYNKSEALRSLDGFDYIWLIWEFNLNGESRENSLTVRPPRLGGNERVGVFASRSPFRPNPIGLSSVKIKSIDSERGIIRVTGADLADGTPIFDIKPYVPYADCHTDARGGYTDAIERRKLKVEISSSKMTENESKALLEILEQDPRPAYHDDPDKIYGISFGEWNVRFSVRGDTLKVISIE